MTNKALQVQQSVRDTGFDWPDAYAVIDKIKEELDELEQALLSEDKSAIQDEFGDVLLVVSNLSLHLGMDMDLCLSQALEKFNRRYQTMLKLSKNQLMDFKSLTLEEKALLWFEAKQTVG